jgi:electron transfer flavoprotein alpha subunit
MQVVVLIERSEGEARKAALQALSLGARLAREFSSVSSGAGCRALVLGGGASAVAKGLGKHGATSAEVVEDASLDTYLAERHVAAIAAALSPRKPFLLLLGATTIGKDLGPRLAQRLGAGYLADVTGLEAGDDPAKPRWIRPIFAGKASEHVDLLTESQVISLRPNAFPLEGVAGAAELSVDSVAMPDVSALGVKVREVAKRGGLDQVELTEAEIIVSGGTGVGSPEGFAPLRELCKTLGAALGASRAAVHADYIGADHQVGQTGKTVSPQLYIACGISGAIQHQAGMRTSKCIVAINKDAEAPIFKIAHYGIVADLFDVVPALNSEFKKILA